MAQIEGMFHDMRNSVEMNSRFHEASTGDPDAGDLGPADLSVHVLTTCSPSSNACLLSWVAMALLGCNGPDQLRRLGGCRGCWPLQLKHTAVIPRELEATRKLFEAHYLQAATQCQPTAAGS